MARTRQKRRRRQDATTTVDGGVLNPLGRADGESIHQAALDILENTGLAEAPDVVVDLVSARGGRLASDDRLCFPRDLVEEAIDTLPGTLVLCGQDPAHDLELAGTRVHAGTGGAAPLVVDPGTGCMRPSTLADLHDAARLVDALDHIRFFSRPLVARDVTDPLALDVNTAHACLAGTTKHVLAAARDARSVDAIARLCHDIAGSPQAFRERPFLSLNINHVTPPLRFSKESATVLVEAVRCGIPAHVNTFGQLGASSPVTIAGSLAQTMAETLAGMVVAWLVDPAARVIFGPRPMVTDLKTGAMAGGSGEQALLTAAAVQMSRHYGLPNSTIAGATTSKTGDLQAGYERCLAVTLAAQAGCNLITQACGMQAGLMAFSPASCVIDNDMLGAIMRTLAPVEVNDGTLDAGDIARVVDGEGHFLGRPATLARMETDFLYPRTADRRSIGEWEADGARDILSVASAKARDILDHSRPRHLAGAIDARLRSRFDLMKLDLS